MNIEEKPAPFTTDGCSGGMSWTYGILFNKDLPWHGACVEHDRAYWYGGTAAQRKAADVKLMHDVAENGYPTIGKLMYYAVRVGGHPLLPTPWRWGYGWAYPRKYTN